MPTTTAADTTIPDSATSAMSTPCSCAMKPRMEKIAKPDTKLVPLFRHPSSIQSLCYTYVREQVNSQHKEATLPNFSFFFFSLNIITCKAYQACRRNTCLYELYLYLL